MVRPSPPPSSLRPPATAYAVARNASSGTRSRTRCVTDTAGACLIAMLAACCLLLAACCWCVRGAAAVLGSPFCCVCAALSIPLCCSRYRYRSAVRVIAIAVVRARYRGIATACCSCYRYRYAVRVIGTAVLLALSLPSSCVLAVAVPLSPLCALLLCVCCVIAIVVVCARCRGIATALMFAASIPLWC